MRENYRFSQGAREYVHKRAGTSCEFPRGCERPNNGIVHHLTGAFEAYLGRKDSRAIRDPDMNAFMLCDPHANLHDAQEQLIVQQLKGERIIYERRIGNKNRRHHRRTQSFGKRNSFKGRR